MVQRKSSRLLTSRGQPWNKDNFWCEWERQWFALSFNFRSGDFVLSIRMSEKRLIVPMGSRRKCWKFAAQHWMFSLFSVTLMRMANQLTAWMCQCESLYKSGKIYSGYRQITFFHDKVTTRRDIPKHCLNKAQGVPYSPFQSHDPID